MMRLRERNEEHDGLARPAMPGAPTAGNTLRTDGQRLLDSGYEAIRRAMSQDSRSFLRTYRQTGGE
jgi:hypothetical protein